MIFLEKTLEKIEFRSYIYFIAYLSQLNDARMAEWQTQQT